MYIHVFHILLELLELVSINSREFKTEIEPIITKSFKDTRAHQNFRFTSAYVVHNATLLNQVELLLFAR